MEDEKVVNEAIRSQEELLARFHLGLIKPLEVVVEGEKIWREAMSKILRARKGGS